MTMRSTPHAPAADSRTTGRLMLIAPATPSVMPTAWGILGSEHIRTIAIEALKIGTMPFNIPARAESMCCCAIGNNRNGTPTQVIPSNATRG